MSLELRARRRAASVSAHVAPAPPLAPQLCAGESRFAGAVLLLGGAVWDVQAWPSQLAAQPGTTVPGEVRHVPGGVARNIAAVLVALQTPTDQPPLLLSVVGDDPPGVALLAHMRMLGLPVDGIRVVPGAATPCVVAVMDASGGDITAAVAACSLVEEQLTVEWVAGFSVELARAPLLLLDTNASPELLLTAAKTARAAGVPVWLEPVSTAKAVKAIPLLPYLTYVSPNAKELAALAAPLGITCRVPDAPFASADAALAALRPAIEALLRAGLSHVITTLGAAGVLLSGTEGHRALPAAAVSRVVSTAGAGDALVAGTLAALAAGEELEAALSVGVAAAAAVVQHRDNAPPRAAFANVPQVAAQTLLRSRRLS